MNRILLGFLIICATGTAGHLGARKAQSTPEIMAKKMALAQQLLAAVVLENFEEIEDAGKELDYLAEFQSWFVLPTPQYAQHSTEFRAAAKSVVNAGVNKDSKAALSSYAAMIDECLKCHQYMKSVHRSDEPR